MRNAFNIVLLATMLRLIVASCTGLGIDESYMVAASDHFAASYFDHPLASWWLELGARWVFGSADPWVVRLPFVLLSAVSSWLLWGLTARLFGRLAGYWAVVAYNLSPVFSLAFGCWVLPDGPLDAALLAAAACLVRAAGIGGAVQSRFWWGAGIFAGLALLSKYSAALVLAGFAFAMLTDPAARRELRRVQPWAAVGVAALMFCPVIAWNAAHHWQSFGYQGGRATGLRFHPFAPLTIWAGEALFVLPWIWLPMIVLMLAAFRRGPSERAGWFLACGAVIPIILFAAVGAWSSTHILYHWAAPGYLFLFPLLGAWLAGWRSAWKGLAARMTAMILALSALAITAELNFNFVPNLDKFFPAGKSPFLQAINWDSIAPEIPPGITAVAALRWYDAGKIGYALRKRGITTTVFGPEPHEFGMSAPPSSLRGQTILIAAMPGDIAQIAQSFGPDFKSMKPGPALLVRDHGVILLVIPTLIGTDLLTAPP